MKFSITYIDATGELRTAKSDDIPAKIAKHLVATINLLESFETEMTTVIQTSELSEEDVAKINMYDALRELGVDSWEGWDLAVERYQEMTSDSEPAPEHDATAEAA